MFLKKECDASSLKAKERGDGKTYCHSQLVQVLLWWWWWWLGLGSCHSCRICRSLEEVLVGSLLYSDLEFVVRVSWKYWGGDERGNILP